MLWAAQNVWIAAIWETFRFVPFVGPAELASMKNQMMKPMRSKMATLEEKMAVVKKRHADILNQFKTRHYLTKSDLAAALDLTPSALSKGVSTLMGLKHIEKIGSKPIFGTKSYCTVYSITRLGRMQFT